MGSVTTRFQVQELDCPAEEQLIRNGLSGLRGIGAMGFNYITRHVDVEHEEGQAEEVAAAISNLGLTVRSTSSPSKDGSAADCGPSCAPAESDQDVSGLQGWWPVLLGVSGVLAVIAEAVAWATQTEDSLVVFGLALGSVLFGGIPTLRKGLLALRTLTLNINFLMTIAVIGAFAIREFPEAAMVTFLFGLAELIESWALDRARRAVASLLEMAPDQATVLQADGSWKVVPATQVAKGAVARVATGERIPLDGIVKTGTSAVNQAPITGESVPVEKSAGDQVFAGTINGDGALEFTATGGVDDTTLARIVRTVQEAQSERAPTQRFVDRFAQFYTPCVCAFALLLAIIPPLLLQQQWDLWLYRSLVLLVVACPCALVISTPVTVVSGLTAAARQGILIKGGVYLEGGQDLRVLALDKTGTITEGRPRVTDVLPHESSGTSRDELLQIAASLDALSQHPVAKAVTDAWTGALLPVTDFQSLTGRGVQGKINGRSFIVGNHRLAEEKQVCSPATEALLSKLEAQGKTVIVVASDESVLGAIGVADRPRETSVEAIRQLHQLGIRLTMLSGDNSTTASAIAKEVGLDDARGDLLPEAKLETIDGMLREFGDASVGMVGDGVNDAPALAKASIGFAMGAAGTDAAIETADVSLMNDDLRGVAAFIELSRRTAQVLTQNIVISLAAKLIFFVFTLFGLATLWMAVLADMGASLLVIANGLRLLNMDNPSGALTPGRRST